MKYLWTFIITLSLFFAFSAPAQAQITCTGFSIPYGDRSTIFSVTASCSPPGANGNLIIEEPDGDPSPSSKTIVIDASGNISTTFAMGMSAPSGLYTAHLFFAGNSIAQTTFTVSNAATAPKKCCNTRADNVANFCSALPDILVNEPDCIVSSGTRDDCPSICQALWTSTTCGGDNWVCAAVSTAPPFVCVSAAGTEGIDTALGCIPFSNITAFVSGILVFGTGLAGGYAFLLFAFTGVLLMTSRGNPDQVSLAKEVFASAIGGLILLIFSGFIMSVIGVDVLGLFAS